LFASWATACVIRRQTAIAGFGKGIGARGAFRPGAIAVALEQ
jgi:hypothetical protein